MIGYPPHLLYLLLNSAMFGFGKRKIPVEDVSTTETATDSTSDSLASRLAKTRRGLGDSMADFFLGKKDIDDNTLDELETSLLSADVGVEATTEIIDDLQSRLSRKALANPRTIVFSRCVLLTVPGSGPPCPASITTSGRAGSDGPRISGRSMPALPSGKATRTT